MATNTATGTTGADTFSLSTWGQPRSGTIYNINGLAGNDTFYLNNNGKTSYNTPFVSTGFTIGTVDANGMIAVSGASSGGTSLTFNLTSVESLVFYDKTVQLSYVPADTTAPTVLSASPANASTGIALFPNIELTFSETIQKGTGLIELHSGSATGPVVESFDAATSTRLTFSGSSLTIDPTNDLSNGTTYFGTIATGSVKDSAGNSFTQSATYSFTTSSDPVMTPMTNNGVSVNPTVYTTTTGVPTGTTAAGKQALHFQLLGNATGDVVVGTSYNDFINVLGADDAVDSGSGNDVVDGGLGSNFLTGGAGTDIFFSDGRGGGTTWSTITDWQTGEELSVWGWTPGTSQILLWQQDGATGYKGLTMHADLDGNGVIDTSVTFTGITSQSQIPTPGEFNGVLWFR